MKILITGIHGFVGCNLISSLKQNHIIYGLDLVSPQKKGVLNTFSWDELNHVPSVDMIIHLAGKAHDTKNTVEEKEYFDINVGLTKIIFEYFLLSNTNRFIFFSSVKAVADSVNKEYLSEDVEPNPGTPYGKSKLEAERIIKELLNRWIMERSHSGTTQRENEVESDRIEKKKGKKVYILRPCMIHGEGNRGNLNLLYKVVSKGIPWPLGAFENKRSFTSMENLQFLIQQLIEKDIEPGIYQVADDEPLSTNQLIDLIAASQDKKVRIWKINLKIIRTLARIGDKLHLPLTSERLKKLTESYIVSNSKIKNALGIEKMPVSAEEGMKKTLLSF